MPKTGVVGTALLTFTAVALAGCSAQVHEDATATTDEALVTKCPAGQIRECDPDGPDGQFLCSCVPAPTPPPPHALEVNAGLASTCALASDATLRCWGQGYAGPTVPILANVAHIAGYSTSDAFCAILKDGTLSCQSPPGEYGDTSITSQADPSLTGVRAVALGTRTACAVVGDGSVRCWGTSHNIAGDHGLSGPTKIGGASAIAIQEVARWADVCAIVAGEVWCQGDALYGPVPARVPAPVASSIVAGALMFCSYAPLSRATCWGETFDGAGWETLPPTAMPVPGLISYSAGNQYPAGLFPPYAVDFNGDLYAGATKVALPSGLTSVSTGAYHACAVQSTGNLYCWGDNSHGEVGGSVPLVQVTF